MRMMKKAEMLCGIFLLLTVVSCTGKAKNDLLKVEKVGPVSGSGEIYKVSPLPDQAKGADQVPAETLAAKSPAPVPPPSAPEPRRVPTRYNIYQYLPDEPQVKGADSSLSEMSREVAGKIFYELRRDGEKTGAGRIAVVNAVPLADFKRDTEFGRIMGEYLLTDLADRGLKVMELRLGKDITILPQTGEFILTRNLAELAVKNPGLEYAVVSTYSNTRKNLVVQGRLVDLADGAVKTGWRYSLPLTRELQALFQQAESAPRVAIKGAGR